MIMVLAMILLVSSTMPVEAAKKKTKQAWKKIYEGCLYEISADDQTAVLIKYKGKAKKVTIPSKVDGKKVTGIADAAFEGNWKLEEVTIPKGVISVGNNVFKNCGNLSKVKLPKSLKSIGDSAFSDCTGLDKIKLPNGLTTIGKSAFSNCTNLTGITIPNTVTGLGEEGFYGCGKLAKVTLPSDLTTIESGLFSICFALTDINIPPSVTEIKANAFYNCVQLENLNIPAGVATIGAKAFGETKWLKNKLAQTPEVVVNGILIDGTSLKGEVTLSDTYTKIGEGAFQADADLARVIFSNKVTEIGENAFASCPSLNNIEISNSVTTIRENAFSDCVNLTSVTLPKTVTNIQNGAFSNTPWLAEQRKAEDLCIINNVLIDGSKAGGNFVIPEQVTHIEKNAFYNSKAESITIPGTVKSIGDNAFALAMTKNIILNEGIQTIGNSAFYSAGIESINIPYSVVEIGDDAFSYCTNLKTVTYNSKTEKVGKALFANCSNLTEVKLAEGISVIGDEAFRECKKLENVHIPGTVKSIGAKAFNFCESLKNVTIPKNVEVIGEAAFADMNATIGILNKKCKIYDSENTISGTICSKKNSKAYIYADKYDKKMKLSKAGSGSKSIALKWKSLNNIDGYQIQYATNSKFKKAKTVKVQDAMKTSQKIKGLKSGKKYYVRIRAYVGDLYSCWSDGTAVTTK